MVNELKRKVIIETLQELKQLGKITTQQYRVEKGKWKHNREQEVINFLNKFPTKTIYLNHRLNTLHKQRFSNTGYILVEQGTCIAHDCNKFYFKENEKNKLMPYSEERLSSISFYDTIYFGHEEWQIANIDFCPFCGKKIKGLKQLSFKIEEE